MQSYVDPAARREIRLLVRLAIAIAVVGLVVLITPILAWFSDLATILFLAWLLAFLIHPLAAWLARLLAHFSYGAAVGLAYAIVGIVTAVVLAIVGISVAQSIGNFSGGGPELASQLAARLAPLQAQLDAAGLGQIHLAESIQGLINAIDLGSSASLNAAGQIVASLAGAVGTISVVVFLSVYMAADREGLLRGVRRLVPERYRPQLAVVEEAVGHSFGGFVRGQVVMGIMYGVVALGAALIFGLPYVALIGVSVAVLQTIPYFGPYVSWAPPVVVAVIFQPDAAIPALVIMLVAQVVLANLIQPRIIGDAVGLSPLAVLVAVLVGAKLAGVLGAIFSVPVAAAAVVIVHRLWGGGMAATPEAAAIPAASHQPASISPAAGAAGGVTAGDGTS